MNTMDSMEMPIAEKVETFKDIIQNISEINDETGVILNAIVDALMYVNHPADNDKNIDKPLSLMDSVRNERNKAQENLRLVRGIRERLW